MLVINSAQRTKLNSIDKDSFAIVSPENTSMPAGNIEIDAARLTRLAEYDTDALGEFLRTLAFTGEGFGCYANFDLEAGFEPVDNIPVAILIELMGAEDALGAGSNTRAEGYHNAALDLTVYWYWDGDGVLIFDAEDFTLVNHDCKCTYDWHSIDLTAQARQAAGT